jgi:hypothetical protein
VPLKVYDRRPVSKRWPIPTHGERLVTLADGTTLMFCDRCHLPKPTEEFRSDSSKDFGLYGTCRQCESGRRRYRNLIDEGVLPPQSPHAWGDEFPTIVCLCGSTRFWRTFQEAALAETVAGNIVLSIGAATATDEDHFAHLSPKVYDNLKDQLDELHLRKIDLADEVLILNVGGYIGASTARELEYARTYGKVVRFLEPRPPESEEMPVAWDGTNE